MQGAQGAQAPATDAGGRTAIAPPSTSAPVAVPHYSTSDLIKRLFNAAFGWDDRTREWYGNYFYPFAKAFPRLPTEPEPIEAYLKRIPEKGTTRYQTYRALNTFYRWLAGKPAARNGMDGRRNIELGIPYAMEYVRSPHKNMKPRQSYTLEELIQVMRATEKLQDRLMMKLLLDTSARTEAVCNLQDTDVHDNYIVIKPKESGQVAEELACAPEMCTTLVILGPGYLFKKDYFKHGGKWSETYGQPLDRYGVYHRISKAFKKAGITWGRKGAHAFRHTAATLRLDKTEDMSLVQAALGHKSIMTTREYTHRTPERTRQRIIETSPFYDLPEDLRGVQTQMDLEDLPDEQPAAGSPATPTLGMH